MSDHRIIACDNLDPLLGLPILADKSIDCTIVDPPYSDKVHGAQRSGHMGREPRGKRATFNRARALGFTPLQAAEREMVAKHIARVTRRWVLAFSDLESVHLWQRDFEAAGIEHVRVGIWHKVGSTPQFTGDRPASGDEAIEIAHPKGKKRWNGGGGHAHWDVPIVLNRGGGNERLHTTQKPLALMEALIREFTEPGELVLDCYAGSGTTGVAAKRLGRRFLGMEKDPAYAEAAAARIAEAREQSEMFATQKRPRAKQAEMFAGLPKPDNAMPYRTIGPMPDRIIPTEDSEPTRGMGDE